MSKSSLSKSPFRGILGVPQIKPLCKCQANWGEFLPDLKGFPLVSNLGHPLLYAGRGKQAPSATAPFILIQNTIRLLPGATMTRQARGHEQTTLDKRALMAKVASFGRQLQERPDAQRMEKHSYSSESRACDGSARALLALFRRALMTYPADGRAQRSKRVRRARAWARLATCPTPERKREAS